MVAEYRNGSGVAIALKIPIPCCKDLRISFVVIRMWKKNSAKSEKNRLKYFKVLMMI